jgi:hypothetical protein
MENRIYRFGSSDSRDEDCFMLVDAPISSIQKCRELADSYKPKDVNLVVVNEGRVVWAFKGTADEMNNSILYTYKLHPSNTDPCPVTVKVERNLDVKISRTVRGILSMCSRTKHRVQIKQALRAKDYSTKIEALKLIQFSELVKENTVETKVHEIFHKGTPTVEIYKFLGFQLIQTLMLPLGDEVYTKQDCIINFPSFTDIIYSREDEEAPEKLQKCLNIFIKYLEKHYKGKTDDVSTN